MAGRRVLLLVNREKPSALQAAAAVREVICDFGEFVEEVDATGDRWTAETASEADLVVVLGGDGTLLGAARRCANCSTPLLGVNFGKLGYLATYSLEALERDSQLIFGSGELTVSTHRFLEARILRGGQIAAHGIALNECVVTAGPPFRVIRLGLHINGAQAANVLGDGLIASTPLGSTAYNVSAGGPVVHPATDAITITPIAAHSLSFRPIVLPGSANVEIQVINANHDADCSGTALVLDGQNRYEVLAGDTIQVSQSNLTTEFVVDRDTSYWTTLSTKMHWARSARTDA